MTIDRAGDSSEPPSGGVLSLLIFRRFYFFFARSSLVFSLLFLASGTIGLSLNILYSVCKSSVLTFPFVTLFYVFFAKFLLAISLSNTLSHKIYFIFCRFVTSSVENVLHAVQFFSKITINTHILAVDFCSKLLTTGFFVSEKNASLLYNAKMKKGAVLFHIALGLMFCNFTVCKNVFSLLQNISHNFLNALVSFAIVALCYDVIFYVLGWFISCVEEAIFIFCCFFYISQILRCFFSSIEFFWLACGISFNRIENFLFLHIKNYRLDVFHSSQNSLLVLVLNYKFNYN